MTLTFRRDQASHLLEYHHSVFVGCHGAVEFTTVCRVLSVVVKLGLEARLASQEPESLVDFAYMAVVREAGFHHWENCDCEISRLKGFSLVISKSEGIGALPPCLTPAPQNPPLGG